MWERLAFMAAWQALNYLFNRLSKELDEQDEKRKKVEEALRKFEEYKNMR